MLLSWWTIARTKQVGVTGREQGVLPPSPPHRTRAEMEALLARAQEVVALSRNTRNVTVLRRALRERRRRAA
jgi:hypothetical protein